jgi:hypothetical protein
MFSSASDVDISLIVLREATVEAEPCKAAFNYPRETGDLEGPLLGFTRAPAAETPSVCLGSLGQPS